MHLSILNNSQQEQLNLLAQFKREFTLVGGTAIALHLGHRRSIDFDLFKSTPLQKNKIKEKVRAGQGAYQLLFENEEGMHLMIKGVKWTFFTYPFPVYKQLQQTEHFKIPSLLTLAAMKAYALGRRAKWKDYVDMHIILTRAYSLTEISHQAKTIFGDAFSEKLLRVQLSYFKDIDYSEEVEWLGKPLSQSTVQKELTDIALSD